MSMKTNADYCHNASKNRTVFVIITPELENNILCNIKTERTDSKKHG